MKVNYLAGKYQLTRRIYPKGLPSEIQFIGPDIEKITVHLTSLEARTLMKGKKNNEDSLFCKLGFDEIELIKEYQNE